MKKKTFSLLFASAMLLTMSFCTQKSSAIGDTLAAEPTTENSESYSALLNLNETMPTVMDFSATWCPPCQQMKPIYEALEKEYEGRIDMRTIDIDDNHDLAEILGIDAVPTIIFFDKDGRETNRLVGFQDRNALISNLDACLK